MIQEKLDLIETSVDGVRSAITEKGGVYEGNISTLPDAIRSIPSGGDMKAFLEDTLTEITVPNGITYLKNYAFAECRNLTKVTLPNSLTALGTLCFINCISLTDINIPSGLTDLNTLCFANCINLNLTLPDSITYIGLLGFNNTGIYNLDRSYLYMNNVLTLDNIGSRSEITIHEGIKFISGNCFYSRSGLLTVNLPESTTLLGCYAFASCSNLVNINLENIQYFNNCCCLGCTKLLLPSDLPNVIAIRAGAFDRCLLPELIHFGESLRLIEYAFMSCTNATNLIFTSDVTITSGSFRSTKVNSVTWEEGVSITNLISSITATTYYLPATTTTVTNGSFNKSKLLFSKDLDSVPVLKDRGNSPNVIVVPDNLVAAFKTATNWSVYNDVIKGWSEYEAELA